MKQYTVRFLSMLLGVFLILGSAGCSGTTESNGSQGVPTSTSVDNQSQQTANHNENRPLVLPDRADKIVSLAPSVTQTLIHLGMADRLVAIDTNSATLEGVPPNLPTLDMVSPNAEQLISLAPDVIFATSLSQQFGTELLKPVEDLGISVCYLKTASTIEEIKEGILFLGKATKAEAKAEGILADMEKEIASILAKIGTPILQKTVYFEIAQAPALYSFGTDVFLDEILMLLGATNILAEESGWVSVSEEVVLQANPDVILTNTDYLEDPVGHILQRNGWGDVTAVAQKQVFHIDSASSSLPNEYITRAMQEMAKAIYPALFD